MTKLQLSAGYSQDQINAMPPPLLKIRELELENGRLQKENDELRRLLTDSTSQARFTSDTALRRPSLSTYADFRGPDRDYKRRRPGHQEDLYIVNYCFCFRSLTYSLRILSCSLSQSPSDTPPHGHDPVSRVPPQLAIPQPHYGNINSNSTSHHNQSAQLFSLPNPGFQMPNTPSGSSATSSPPFSASVSHY